MTESENGTDPIGSPVGVGLVTVATNRPDATGAGGEEIATYFEGSDCEVAMREHVNKDYDTIQSVVSRLVDRDDVDLIVTSGGTSVEPADVTPEAVEPLVEKHLTAFSELFTTLAYREFGTQVVAARCFAGIADEVPVFCLPPSRDAVRLGLEELVLPEARQLVTLARGDEEASSEPEPDAVGPEETDADE
ncbi:MogA/MoaB family molybdenum cofactor biosynthesis protein [Natronococcus jeotgali]|uniref:Molybdenum cofactor synthesis protein n=1 Tax=Natronococcus jeotgali DSM 18795 TaxID=1227498 RepID=L9WQT7_9EURY|nr:molybdopterin-binding protein [Natronococcus jeotgali]ELY51772.1 molybdenum cofactor synthesis protein [Natronococcus jeotgali DSM 18795]